MTDGDVTIIVNVRRCEGMPGHGGWLPSVTVNGREVCDTWAARPFDESEAWEAAQARAEREAARYVGGWNVTIRRG